MAEFCLNCWNKINGRHELENKYIISKDLDFCEGCSNMVNVIIMKRKNYYQGKFRFVTAPFKLAYKILFILWRILILPYLVYKYHKTKNKDDY